ncbi:MAG: carbohydrate kinase family protein [Candidatus Lokiarchaeota archaeon]|nr:carbohydrate kinase family protein [Candidatus Lokiarchaeota archaeon]
MKTLDVISIGAVLLDINAKVERFPSIDDEVFVPELIMSGGGSAANIAIACSRLGLKSAFIGKIGKDANGEFLKKEFLKENVNINGLVQDTNYNTGMCFIPVSKGERMIFAHSGAANHLNPEDIKKNQILSTKIVLLASLKNLKPLIQAAEYAKDEDILVALNPGTLIADQDYGTTKELVQLTDIFISSEKELNKIMNEKYTNISLKKILKMGPSVVAMTRGSKGALISEKNQRKEIPAYKVKVVDTTGAGDSFTAGFLAGYLEGKDLEICGKMGNANAAILIQNIGARNQLAKKEILEDFIKKN